MNTKGISDRLQVLARGNESRSKTAQLREIIEDVEKALAAGVGHTAIVEELAKEGLFMTVGTFGTTLRRIRKKNFNTSTRKPFHLSPSPAQDIAQTASPSPQRSLPEPSALRASHDPADIEKILNSPPDLDALIRLGKGTKR